MENIKKDFFGNVLEVGDIVAFPSPTHKSFLKGKIVKLTNQNVTIEYHHWLYGTEKTSRHPSYVIKEIKELS